MRVVLSTERIVMRRHTMHDLDAVTELDADPAVMRWLTGGEPTPRDVAGQILRGHIAAYDSDPTHDPTRDPTCDPTRGPDGDPVCGHWAAEVDGTFVGWFGLRTGSSPYGSDEPPRADPELGYRLRRAVWGAGLATEGSVALLDRAFAAGFPRVWAQTMTVNTASRRVLTKLGMRHVRTHPPGRSATIPGAEHGDVEYEITRDDWLGRV